MLLPLLPLHDLSATFAVLSFGPLAHWPRFRSPFADMTFSESEALDDALRMFTSYTKVIEIQGVWNPFKRYHSCIWHRPSLPQKTTVQKDLLSLQISFKKQSCTLSFLPKWRHVKRFEDMWTHIDVAKALIKSQLCCLANELPEAILAEILGCHRKI